MLLECNQDAFSVISACVLLSNCIQNSEDLLDWLKHLEERLRIRVPGLLVLQQGAWRKTCRGPGIPKPSSVLLDIFHQIQHFSVCWWKLSFKSATAIVTDLALLFWYKFSIHNCRKPLNDAVDNPVDWPLWPSVTDARGTACSYQLKFYGVLMCWTALFTYPITKAAPELMVSAIFLRRRMVIMHAIDILSIAFVQNVCCSFC